MKGRIVGAVAGLVLALCAGTAAVASAAPTPGSSAAVVAVTASDSSNTVVVSPTTVKARTQSAAKAAPAGQRGPGNTFGRNWG